MTNTNKNLTEDGSNTVTLSTTERVSLGLKKRHRKEKRFKLVGLSAVLFGFLLVIILLGDITSKALPAFYQNWVKLDVNYKASWLNINESSGLELKNEALIDEMNKANYRNVLRKSLYEMFPEVSGRKNKRNLTKLLSSNAEFTLKDNLIASPLLFDKQTQIWVRLDDDVDSYLKEGFPEGEAGLRLNENQAQWVAKLTSSGRVESRFNFSFFTSSDSREPELAGIKGALMGTLLTMFVTLLLSFPLGVAGALYLEEFAPKNRITDFIEININNLAAVPSIVYGLLGLGILLGFMNFPRSTPLVAGITLALMTLPRIIIPCRASLKAVPPSIREGALAVGASKFQSVFHHVVPLSLPGTLSGTIIGLAQALGETAPLILIGMVAFVVDIPGSPIDPASSLPAQVYLWSESAERGFVEKTSATIMILLTFLIVMNFIAVYLRQKFEKKWN